MNLFDLNSKSSILKIDKQNLKPRIKVHFNIDLIFNKIITVIGLGTEKPEVRLHFFLNMLPLSISVNKNTLNEHLDK